MSSAVETLRETPTLTFAIHMLQTLPFAALKPSKLCLYITELSMSYLNYELSKLTDLAVQRGRV